MEPQMIDLAVPLFFLSALVLVARFKKQLAEQDKESYRYISSGLVIVTLMTLSQVYSRIGLFDTVPFLSIPLFFRLIYWIGIIAGLTFLVSGISHWLPLSQTYRKYNQVRLMRLEFIKKVEQLVGVERRMSVILSRTLKYMVNHYCLLKGAVYLYSQKQKTLVFLSCSGSAQMTEADVKGILFDEDFMEKLSKNGSLCDGRIVREVPETMLRPNLALPVVVEGRLSALFLLWYDEKADHNNEDRVNLKIAADIIARKLMYDKLRLAEDFRTQENSWLQSFGDTVDYRKNIKENLPGIARWFTVKVPAELISLTIIYDKMNIQRFSIGGDGMLLAEKAVDLYSNHFLEYIVERGEPLVVKDVRYKTALPIDKMLLSSSMRSLAAFPLDYERTTIGAVVVASKQANNFTSREIELIKSAMPLLSNLAAREISRYEQSIINGRIELLDCFLADCMKTVDLQKLFNRAAKLLSRELKTSVVRISTFDHDGLFLKSQALALLRPIEGIVPPDGDMILSLMPYHTKVRDTGRLMMINQQDSDKKITEAEAKQMAGADLKSALLVPVKVDQQALAVISLAEMRAWDRYQYTRADIQFASLIATALSLAVQMRLSRQTKAGLTSAPDRFTAASFGDADVKSRIKSSLSGILGSVEIIKSRTPAPDASLDRYLSIIDTSAKRINQYFTEEVVS